MAWTPRPALMVADPTVTVIASFPLPVVILSPRPGRGDRVAAVASGVLGPLQSPEPRLGLDQSVTGGGQWLGGVGPPVARGG